MSTPSNPAYALGYSLGTVFANGALVLLGLAVVALVVFLIFREFWTWYWKQSEQVALLKSIDASLKTLAERSQPAPAAPAAPTRPGWVSVPPVWPTPPANASATPWQRPPGWLPSGGTPTP